MWRLDGTGIIDAGDVGGDIQAGPAWSVRYYNDEAPGALITVNVYAVDWRGLHGPDAAEEYAVQTQTEFLICTDMADPGGTEVWSDYQYDDSALAWPVLAQAELEAIRSISDYNTERAASLYFTWDGRTTEHV